MGNRLSKIVTKTGDKGTTGLGDGNRVPKNALRVESMGAVDETNSIIGIVVAECYAASQPDNPFSELLQKVQNDLFDLGGELSMPGYQFIDEKHVERLETWIVTYNEQLPPLKNFILPGGNRAAAYCHLARSVCRRAERVVVSLSQQETLNSALQRYLNRLSDLLFVLARTLARQNEGQEILWQKTEWKQ
jgi:cob(I)alamin adenosyltransferase